MPEFQTIPAEEGALLQKPKASLRRVIVCAAALSFALAQWCPGGFDWECDISGVNTCTKCDTTPGTRFKCVPP